MNSSSRPRYSPNDEQQPKYTPTRELARGDSKRLWLRNGELATDFACEMIRDLLVPGDRFDVTGERIAPEFVFLTLALEKTTEVT